MLNNKLDLNSDFSKIYQQGKKLGDWNQKIDWTRLHSEKMPDDLRKKSVFVSKSSSYVEQIGMANAALLLQRCEDINLKLGLAQAVNDEARHAEVFLRYAQELGAEIPPLETIQDELTPHFDALTDFDLIFLSHVYLENLALEQFNIFINSFKGVVT
ncbi:hypothetical protein [Polycladidibacter stylochi]|uniref:hypothetical protein n=1 Tax=Polycladidibacter stylochi TaxID=1807766 RepID=UPI000830BF05|nr:hypothetical protein [Pseudovibrio stylochi]